MDDLHLIELASKASGMTFSAQENPLERDDLALRLAVKLEINIAMYAQRVKTYVDNLPRAHQEDFGTDPYAATRRAIVRAAACIGEQMK